jgi:hypothetical protein
MFEGFDFYNALRRIDSLNINAAAAPPRPSSISLA